MDKINIAHDDLAFLPGYAKSCFTSGNFDEGCRTITMVAKWITWDAQKLSWNDISEILIYFNTILIPAFKNTKFNVNTNLSARFYQEVDTVENAAYLCLN